jgi:hypothetical protein
MLKIRNLIFALSLSPLLSIIWQFPNHAQQAANRSSNTAGGNSGANTGGSQTSIFSGPPTVITPSGNILNIPIIFGVSSTITTGVSTRGHLTAGGTKVQILPGNIELNSSSITVIDGATNNSVIITLSPQDQITVNQLAAAIIKNLISTTAGKKIPPVILLMNGGARAEGAAVFVTNSLTTAGISPARVQAIVQELNGLFASPNPTASLPNLPVAQPILGQLTASNKVIKPVSVIAQGEETPNVSINKLNDAIVIYNEILLESKPETLRNLDKNADFVLIGQILKQLRTAI